MKTKAKMKTEWQPIDEEQQDQLATLLNLLEETVTRKVQKLSADFINQAFKDIRTVLDSTIDYSLPRSGEYWVIQLNANDPLTVASIHGSGSRKTVYVTGDDEGYSARDIHKFVRKIDTTE